MKIGRGVSAGRDMNSMLLQIRRLVNVAVNANNGNI
jgi:hypothetical protein